MFYIFNFSKNKLNSLLKECYIHFYTSLKHDKNASVINGLLVLIHEHCPQKYTRRDSQGLKMRYFEDIVFQLKK